MPPATPPGWDEAGLETVRDTFERLASAALVFLNQGRVVLALGDVDERYTGQSLRKPFVGALIGLAIAEGRLSLETTLAELELGTDDPPLLPGQEQATIENLLMSRSGIMHSALYEVGYWKRRRAEQARTAFLGDQLGRDIAQPLAMQDFRSADVTAIDRNEESERRLGNHSVHDAYMVEISTRDLARFGLFYLACGRWAAKQVIPADWVLASISGPRTIEGGTGEPPGDWGRYGFLWWDDSGPTRTYTSLGGIAPMAFAHGYRGHFLGVVPALDLVVAHLVATVCGIGTAAQLDRLHNGSPEVSDQKLDQLLGLIVDAHPASLDN